MAAPSFPVLNGTYPHIDGAAGQYNEEEEEDDVPDDDSDEEEEEDIADSPPIDEELAAHALSLSTQWVVASNGERHDIRILCRASVQDFSNELIYDRFVAPPPSLHIVDFRTPVTGFSPGGNLVGPQANSFETVQADIAEMIRGRLLIGYKLWESLHLLNLSHRLADTRDLALYLRIQPELRPGNRVYIPLPALTYLHLPPLHRLPQASVREDPADEAEAQMFLYHVLRAEWEEALAQGRQVSAPPPDWFLTDGHNYYTN